MTGPDSAVQALVDRLAAYQGDAPRFVREVLGARPTDQQQALLQAVSRPGAHVSVRSGHGTGKSTALAWTLLWFVSCFGHCKIPCTAPSSHQLDDVLWPEIMQWRNRMDPWFRDQILVSRHRVSIRGREETRFAVARTARPEKPEALQGFHAPNLLFIIDEASGVHEKIFEVAQGALSTAHARVVMCANPTQVNGYFYESHHRHRDHWTRLHFSCQDSPLVSPEYVESMAQKYGRDSDMFRVRVLGDFPRASIAQLIPLDQVEQAMGRHLVPSQYHFAPVILGVDVAWMGDDRSAVFLRQGLRSRLLGSWSKIDNMTLAGLVAQFEDAHKASATFVDVGWGSGVIDRLRQMGRSPVPVNFGGAPLKDRYHNKRAEIWVELRDWLEQGGSLPDLPDLKDDLTGPQYAFSPTGKILLERKEDMKKRGLASPDLGDALALTFAMPVHPAPPAASPAPDAPTPYDPLTYGMN